jgi:galacturan 1,4-alpha-galacturonidase
MQSTALQVSDVTYSGFQGTSVDEEAIRLDCSDRGCINIVMDNINITSLDPGKTTYAYCEHTSGTSWFTAPYVPCLSVSGY